MPEIIEVDGDITKFNDAQVIVHQCNCVTTVAAHLAKTIFEAFPWADIYTERAEKTVDYKNLPKGERPGDIIVKGNGEDQRWVIAILGQVFPGRPRFPDSKTDGTEARAKYFVDGIKRIMKISNLESIAFPDHIGCGAAGGDWTLYRRCIEAMAEKLKDKTKVYIVNFNK